MRPIPISRRAILAGAASLAGLTVVAAAARMAIGAGTPAYRIVALHAHLYYYDKGAISPDVLHAPHGFALWNAVAGDGDAKGLSTATMVTVEIVGPESAAGLDQNLTLVANAQAIPAAPAHEVLRETRSIGYIGPRGRAFVPFLLYGTGCAPIQLTAHLAGQSASATVTDKIPFACGE